MRRAAARTSRDRRRRRRLIAKATRLHSPTLEARLLDFSRAGFALETTQGLRIGQRHVFRIEKSAGLIGPERPKSSGTARSLVGVVRWCRLRTTRPLENGDIEPVFCAGLSFEKEPDPEG